MFVSHHDHGSRWELLLLKVDEADRSTTCRRRMRRGEWRRRPSPPHTTTTEAPVPLSIALFTIGDPSRSFTARTASSQPTPLNSRSCRPSAGSQTPWSILRHACMAPETRGDGQDGGPAAPLARRASRAPRSVVTGETRRSQLRESRGRAKAGRRASSAPPPPPPAA